MTKFALPPDISDLIAARNRVRDHYGEKLRAWGNNVELSFTFDGNLIGDLGEALAMDLFDIQLVETKSNEAIDGFAPDGRSIQVKATGTGRGPAFRQTELRPITLSPSTSTWRMRSGRSFTMVQSTMR